MTIYTLLASLRNAASTERDKGARFEKLIVRWLLADPTYAAQFDEAWLWADFAKRAGLESKADMGIDIVARRRDGQGLTAVQCKFYDETTSINKSAVDSFISASGKLYKPQAEGWDDFRFTGRLWVSTSESYGPNAHEAMQGQDPAIVEVTLAVLDSSPVDWEALAAGKEPEPRQPATPRDYQADIVARAIKHFETHDRGTLVMACGTGKTLTSLFLAQALCQQGGDAAGKCVLFLAPSIALVSQTLRSWYASAAEPITAACVCSDSSASSVTDNLDGDTVNESLLDLPIPSTTNPKAAAQILQNAASARGLTVIFSTYQSIDVVHQAQEVANVPFDLVICDEAHRTAASYLQTDKEKGRDATPFARIHDADYIRATRRLYMTATPKVYATNEKTHAEAKQDTLFSMDDETTFGPRIYTLSFGMAVEKGLLTDYKVIVLTLGANSIPTDVLESVKADAEARGTVAPVPEITTRIFGAVAAMSKLVEDNMPDEKDPFDDDPDRSHPLRTAIAFCDNVYRTKKTAAGKIVAGEAADALGRIVNQYAEAMRSKRADDPDVAAYLDRLTDVVSNSVTGDMPTNERERNLQILREPVQGESHIVCNVSCLSEGVDVPALDAVIFLSPRRSPITLVQSVGRVMRRFQGKKYGYVIVPVIVNDSDDPNTIVRSTDFQPVWNILCALRSHDEALAAELSSHTYNHVRFVSPRPFNSGPKPPKPHPVPLPLVIETNQRLYARMSEVVGDKMYWPRWSQKAGEVATRFIERISAMLAEGRHTTEMQEFVAQLRESTNDTITQADAVTFLAQHMVTRPVFEAIFADYDFAANNAVSRAMEHMLAVLENEAFADDRRLLDDFRDQVKRVCHGLDTPAKRQDMIKTLYEQFFRAAFPRVAEQMGIVYTPVECVDFIVRSVDALLRRDFGLPAGIASTKCLDPFAGTGTFTARALQFLAEQPDVPDSALRTAYATGLHSFEIVPLSYYVADVNIETVFNGLERNRVHNRPYERYEGISLTDTFQLTENRGTLQFAGDLGANAQAAEQVIAGGVPVIWGNPPYSVGQKSANDNAQNTSYPALEARIAATYAVGSAANSVKSLYDSYIKAFRWATDRIAERGEQGGIVAFISNAGWIEGSGQDGMRRCLEREWDSVYIFHLRGNQRTSGELSRREGGKIFGSGSRTPIAITILVRRPGPRPEGAKAQILLADVGDYLTREDKLARLTEVGSVCSPAFAQMAQEIHPNDKADWLNQRDGSFDALTPISPEKKFDPASKSFFIVNSLGQATAKDPFLYSFSKDQLRDRAKSMIDFYNENRIRFHAQKEVAEPKDFVEYNPQRTSWNAVLLQELKRNDEIQYDDSCLGKALYRPFMVQNVYYDRRLLERAYQIPSLFPTPRHRNLAICITGTGAHKFGCVITDCIPDLNCCSPSQCYPLWRYESRDDARRRDSLEGTLFAADPTAGESAEGWAAAGYDADGYRRRSALTDYIVDATCRAASISMDILAEWRLALGGTLGMLADAASANLSQATLASSPAAKTELAKEAIFFITYGLLHDPEWRTRFAPDLKKGLPRLALPCSPTAARQALTLGHQLALLHLYGADGIWHGGPANPIPPVPEGMQLMVGGQPLQPTETATGPDFPGLAITLPDKMRWPSKTCRDTLLIAEGVSLTGIPASAQRYVVNGKSALEWLVERIAVGQDKASGIVNNPNDWAREQGDPAFVARLVWRVACVAAASAELLEG